MKILNLLLYAGLALASSVPQGHSYRDISRKSSGIPPQAQSTASPSQQPNFTFDELYALQKKFYDNFIYPNNAKQAKAINSSLLAKDVLGRVDITRTFNGRELNTEYLFGLFANLADAPGQISLLGVPLSYEILHFAANENIVSVSTKFMFNFTALNLVLPIRIDSWNTYNSAGELSQYDATFVWWDWAVATLLKAAAGAFGANSTEAVESVLQKALAKSICGTATQYCNGTNAQYQSADQCIKYLTQTIRFGQPWELGRNTLLCRMVHQNMVPFRPSVHCPHIGPTGGGYCTDDLEYTSYLNQDYFTNSPYIPAALTGATQSGMKGKTLP